MRVQHNIAAMNAYRNFSTNNSKLNKNLEKLSTGYKINRAGDDAAGLAISEKMRAQISGIEGATKNSKDGISLIQTAEGALTEVHDMLNRMTTLAEQSANGTYDDEVDRVQLQKEVDALKSEINRIADSTNYNGMKLLNGELDSTSTNVKDTTVWTTAQKSNSRDQLIAAQVSTSAEVGTGTIVHDEKSATKSEFSVQLNNTAPSFDINDASDETIEITIGTVGDAAGNTNQKLSVTGAEISKADGDTTAAKIANAIVNKYGVYGKQADGTATPEEEKGLDIKTDSGKEHFDISLGEDGTSIKFTQSNAPTSDDNLVNTRMGVKVEVRTEYTPNLPTALTEDAANETASKLAFADSKSPAFAAADGTTVTEDDLRALQAQLAESGGLNFSFTVDASGNDVAAATAADNIVQAGKTKVGIEADGLGANYKLQFKSADDSWVDVDDDLATSNSAAGAVKVDSNKITDIDFRVVADGSETALMSFTLKTSDLEFKGQSDGSGNAVTPAPASVAKATFSLTVDKSGDKLTTQDYNASTTVITAGDDRPGVRLASTYMEGKTLAGGDNDFIKDGSMIEIGGTAYTFAVGEKSTVDVANTKNVVDLRDLAAKSTGELDTDGNDDVLKKALQRLTEAAKDNEMYSVGYNENGGTDVGGHLTLTEKETYSGGVDLSTVDNIAKTIRFAEKATSEIDSSAIAGKALTLQIGDTSESFNKMSVDIKDMHADSIGIGDVDISTQEGASKALDSIKNAVNVVSDVRGSLGALQNRLDHTINNLGVMRENIQNAESLIRDTDVAEEMMAYTKNNILNQSAQAMLAQANQLPQGVLQLLG